MDGAVTPLMLFFGALAFYVLVSELYAYYRGRDTD